MVQPIQIEGWISGETVVHPWMGPAYFNSSFSTRGLSATRNAKLTIHLRVWLEEVKPTTPKNDFIDWPQVWNHHSRTWVPWLTPWPPGAFESFRSSFKSDIEDFWGDPGFCLMPVQWEGLDWPLGIYPTHRVNVDCGLEIVWAHGPDDAHVMFYCANFLPQSRRSSGQFLYFLLPGTAHQTGVGLISQEARCNFGICGNPNAKARPGSDLLVQVPYILAHEIGHGLGMPHIGVSVGSRQCVEDSAGSNFFERFLTRVGLRHPGFDDMNADSCYIGRNDEDTKNIMGWGRKISFANAMPWLLRLTEHTHTTPSQWMICMGERSPTPLSLLVNARRN
jgi:hypothetical protein